MKASIKRINIDPPIGAVMAGYSERTHGCESIHDSIEAVILVLDDGKTKSALVSCDVIGIDAAGVAAIRNEVQTLSGLSGEHILISAVHTHSSVLASKLKSPTFNPQDQTDPETDKAYYHLMLKKITGGILWAIQDLEPVSIGFGQGNVIGMCTNRNDPKGYFDPCVNILRIDRKDGSIMAVAANFACHPTILNQTNYAVTGDFVSTFREQVNKALPGCTAMYLQGAAGSVSTRFTKKDSSFSEVQRLAGILTEEVLRVVPEISMTQSLNIRGKTKKFILPVKEFLPEEQCLALIEDYSKHYEKLISENADPAVIRRAYVTLQGAQRNYAAKKQITFTEITTEMQCLDFGICSFISLPGDVFGEIGRDIRLNSSFKNPCITAYANDTVGYVVSKEGYAMECYEKNMSIFDIRAQEIIIETAIQLENSLQEAPL